MVLRVYPHEEAARRRREAMLPVLQSGQHPHEVLDTQLTPWCGKAGRELRWAGSLRSLANGRYRGGVGAVYCVQFWVSLTRSNNALLFCMLRKLQPWSTDTEGCSWDPEEERERGEELPDQALAMDEEDLEEALEAAALDELEEELE